MKQLTLENLLSKAKGAINSGSERSQIVKKNAFWSFIIKILSIGIDFAKVPILLSYLTQDNYGLYVTIASIVYWTHNFDFGLGTGLRYKLTAAISNFDYKKGREFVSTAYVSLSVILLGIITIALPIIYSLNWNTLLNAGGVSNHELLLCIVVVLVVFITQFVLELVTYVLQAYQRSALSSIFKPISNLVTLIVILILRLFSENSLLYACMGLTIPIVIVLLLSNIILYKGLCYNVRPSLSYYNSKCLKDIYSLGLKFFASQIANLVVYQTAAFLISHFVDPAEAAAYNTAFTYFGIIVVFNTMMMMPLSAAVTDAYVKEDYVWMKGIIRRISKVSLILSLLSLVVLGISPVVFHFWIEDKLEISWMLRIFMTIYFILNIWTTPYSSFISGVGKMNVAMISSFVKIAIYIPVAIFLVKQFSTSGIMLAIIVINTIPNNILYTLQYKKIVNRTARGIWNK